MKFLSLLLVTALAVLGIFLVAGSGSARAETLYVDDDAAPWGNGSLETPYQTIQDAIDHASAGDTIRVFNGTYLENVVVYKRVNLIGNATVNTTIDGGGNGDVVSITADWCNISGFAIMDGGTGPVSGEAGIKVTSTHNNITGNNVSNNNHGIYLDESSSNTVKDNIISSNSKTGIKLFYSNSNNLSNNSVLINGGTGISLVNSDSNTLTNNVMVEDGMYISGDQLNHWNTHTIETSNSVSGKPVYYWKNQTSGTVPAGAGEVLIANCTGITVENQNVSGGSVGIGIGFSNHITLNNNTAFSNNIHGIILSDSSSTILTNNNISDNLGGGIYLLRSDNNTLSNNTASSNEFNGIFLAISDNNTMENNTASMNDNVGFYIFDSDSNNLINNTISENFAGIYIRTNSMDNSGYNNFIYNNTNYGINATDNNGYTIDATNNWWGNNSGPYHPTQNPDGTGDNVTDDVLFDPWTGKQSEEQNTSVLYVATYGDDTTGDGSEDNPYLTIQKAIDSATNDTHTIRVFEGTYLEEILVNRTLTIQGNSSSNTTIDGFTGSGDTVNITSDNVTFEDLTVRNAFRNAITVNADHVTIRNCSIEDSTSDGINATNVTGLEIVGCLIRNNGENGIIIDPSDTISITGTTITGNDYGLVLVNTTATTISDSDLTGNTNFDIVLNNSAGTANMNSTFGTVDFQDNESAIDILGSLDLTFMDDLSTPVDNATVIITDFLNQELFNGLTDANGTIPHLVFTGAMQNITGTHYYTPITIEATRDVLRNVTDITEIKAHVLELVMREYVPPEAKITNDSIIFIDETESVDFDATPSTGEDLSFFWLWEDETNYTLDATPPTRTYNKAGVYIINLTVTDSSNETDSLEIRVVVTNIAPTNARITGGNKTGDEDEELTFDATAQDTLNDLGSLIYSWDFGNGQFGFGESTTHSYSNQGNYTVNLTVMDDDGAVTYAEINVTISNRNPNANGRALNEPTSPGEDMYFTGEDSSDPDTSDIPELTFFWEFGDGNSTNGMFVSWPYARPGSYTVNLTVTDDNGATDTDSFTVDVDNQDPVAVPGDDIFVIKGENFTLDGRFSNDPDEPNDSIVNWSWDMDDDTEQYGKQITYHYDETGEYDVTLTVRDTNGAEDEATIVVTVLNDPPYRLSIVASNDTIVQGMTVNFTGSANDTNELTYSWDFGDGNTSEGSDVSHTFVKAGTITVTLFVTDGMDEVNITTEIEVTNIRPNATFTPDLTEADVGDEITFTAGDDLDVPGEELTYNWKFGDGSTGTGVEVKHTYTTTGVMKVELVVNDGTGNSDPFTVDITINNEAPTPRITLEVNTTRTGEVVVFDGSTSSDPTNEALTYTWDFGDNSSSRTGVVVTHKYAAEGTYTVTLTVSDGANEEDASTTITVTKAPGGTTTTEEGGGMGMITYLACGASLILLIFLVLLVLFVTDKKPKEITNVIKMFKEGKTVKDMASRGGGERGVTAGAGGTVGVVMGVEAVEVEAVVEGVVSGKALEAALVAEVEIAGESKGKDTGGKMKREVKLIDEEVDEFSAKKASYQFSLHKLERERDVLKSELDKEEIKSRKKETERQLSNIEYKITKQSERVLKLTEEAEKEKLRREEEKKAATIVAGGAVGVGAAGGEGEEFDPEAVAASIPKPESLAALEEARNAIDRVHPEKDNELDRKRAELEEYADYADDPDYAEYVADLTSKVTAMEKMEKKRGDKGFPRTSEVAEVNEKMKAIKAKGKKGASKDDKEFIKNFTPKIQGFEGLIGRPIDELLDELYAESAEEIDIQIAEEEAAWEEAKVEAVARAEEEFNARKAKAEAAAKAESAAPDGEAEVVEAEAVEAVEAEAVEAVEAEAVEAEAVEAEAVEGEGVEVEGVEIEGVEVEGVEVEGVELEGVEVEGVEVEGVEIEGVELESVEVEGVEMEGVELEDTRKKPRRKGAKPGVPVAPARGKTTEKPGASQVTCPQCKSQLAVGTDRRPFTFSCPKCRQQITLQAKPGEKKGGIQAGGKPGTPAAGSAVICPRCRSSLNVGTTQRPFTFNCPKCSQRITLQSPGMGGTLPGTRSPPYTSPGRPPTQPGGGYGAPGGPGYPSQPPSRYPGAGPGGAPSYPPGGQAGVPQGTIKCPRCQSQLDISRMPRPSTFNCPNCSSRIEIR